MVPEPESRLLAWAMNLYKGLMPHSPGERYLRGRGLVAVSEAGWAPGGRFLLGRDGPDGQPVGVDELAAAGLVYATGRGRGMDILRHRVVVPYTWYGRTSCLYGRTVHSEAPKAERHRFTAFQGKWERGLFREGSLKSPCFAVVEGALDAVALTQLCGVPTVAFGTVRYRAGIVRLSRLPRRQLVLLAFDRDDQTPSNPGESACIEVSAALAQGPRVQCVRPGAGHKDWASVAEYRAAELRQGRRPESFRLARQIFTPTAPLRTRPTSPSAQDAIGQDAIAGLRLHPRGGGPDRATESHFLNSAGGRTSGTAAGKSGPSRTTRPQIHLPSAMSSAPK